ncbi:MAG: cyclic nucleotide-binding domain-containing protein [Ignavibacteria bacterium]|nr:cyclic nucleotide-binding domain-containing protein [Ignavibacteria bacterium]
MEDLSGILKQHPFIEDLSEEYVKQITGCASNVVFHENDIIFKEGEKAEKFYLIRTGMIALEFNGRDKGMIRIETIGPGQMLGWSWLVSPNIWHFTAHVIEEVRAIAMDGECLRKKCEKDTKMGYEMYKRFSLLLEQRLQSARQQLLKAITNT